MVEAEVLWAQAGVDMGGVVCFGRALVSGLSQGQGLRFVFI